MQGLLEFLKTAYTHGRDFGIELTLQQETLGSAADADVAGELTGKNIGGKIQTRQIEGKITESPFGLVIQKTDINSEGVS